MGNSAASLYVKLDDEGRKHKKTRIDISALHISGPNSPPSTRVLLLCISHSIDTMIQAGTTVRGCVTVDLSSLDSVQNVTDYVLTLEITGKEKVCIREGPRGSRAERRFLESKFTLHDFKHDDLATVLPGWHDFPFSFDLPGSMPSTMKCSDESYIKHSSHCQIKYKMKAFLCQRGASNHSFDFSSSFSSMTSSISKLMKRRSSSSGHRRSSSGGSSLLSARDFFMTEREFVVQSKPSPAELVPYQMEPITQLVKTFGLVSQGTVSFGVNLEDTHVSKGDDLDIYLAARNDSTVNLEIIILTLLEVVEFSTDNREGKGRTKIVTKVLEEVKVTDSFIGMQRREQVYRNTITGIDQLHRDNQHHIFLELQAKTQKANLRVPTSTRDSLSCQLIKCSHFLEIKVMTVQLVDDLKVRVPLMLLNYHGIVCDTAEVHNVPPPGSRTNGVILEDAETPAYYITSTATEEERLSASTDLLQRTRSMAPSVAIPMRSGGLIITQEALRDSQTSYMSDSSCDTRASAHNVVGDHCFEFAQDLPSLKNLLQIMLASMDDYELIQAKCHDPEWRNILSSLSPNDFGSVIGHVNLDFDQPRVASFLASQIVSKFVFTCEHCKAALRNTTDWNRVTMVQRLLPFCCDLGHERNAITNELTPWELTLTANDFALALAD